MSGGHFDYKQYVIGHIADEIEQLALENDEYGYSEDTLDIFKNAVECLKASQILAQRIDYLVSGDDGEETFHKRLVSELEKLFRGGLNAIF